jgi:excisionase family DNA binding protein
VRFTFREERRLGGYMEAGAKRLYPAAFKVYPDVMDVTQVSDMLRVSAKTVYKLIHCGSLSALKVGREFRIPKVSVMRYISPSKN